MAGDISGDGVVDAADVISTVNFILGLGDPPTDKEMAKADVNNDGILDVRDLLAIINIILALE